MKCFYKSFVVTVYCIMMVLGSEKGCCMAFDEKKVTDILQTSFDCHYDSNPAMAVALVKDGQTLYSRGIGYTTLENKTAVTDETIFGIASVTKSFAAALFVKLLHEKTRLTFNSKVEELIGTGFVLADKFRTKETTFLDMLSHKTAILANNRIRMDTNLTRDTVLRRLRLLPSNKQFRVDYIYNNLVYGVIGRLTESLGGHDNNGKRWEDLVKEHLFEPLGMKKSTFATRIDFDQEHLATAYSDLDGPGIMTKISPELSRKWADLCASGAIMSSVKDMTNWLNFHLSGGKNETGHQVMDEKLVEELHKPRLVLRSLNYLGIEQPEFPITVMETAYAMGLRVGHYRGYPLIAHTGGTYGYGSYMIMLPAQKIGAIILTTGRDVSFRQRAAVAHYLIDSALGMEPYINSTTICTFPKPWVNKDVTPTFRPKRSNETPVFEVDEYTAMYTDKAFGNLEIRYDSKLDSLVMHYGWGVWEMMVWPDADDKNDHQEQRFFGKGIGPDFAPDMKPLYFIEHPERKRTIIGLRGTAFEKKLPPIFCKEGYLEACEAIRMKTYPEVETEAETVCKPNSAISLISNKKEFGFIILFIFALIEFAKSMNAY